ncbi:MAG: thioredoxin [Bacteroidales bacterium]|nr:thioredoxin [Candidatus Cryptobacteroides choladohippi]MCQ2180244.1 thioredoxin [Bacteroidales bacterium]
MEKVITENNIDEVMASGQPVVIDFWAPWCGPCRVLGPTVDEVANQFAGRVIVAKCNVDDCEDIATKYGIRNIPSVLFFKNGELADRTVGLVSKAEIVAKIENLL